MDSGGAQRPVDAGACRCERRYTPALPPLGCSALLLAMEMPSACFGRLSLTIDDRWKPEYGELARGLLDSISVNHRSCRRSFRLFGRTTSGHFIGQGCWTREFRRRTTLNTMA